jgi:hypothetical protein
VWKTFAKLQGNSYEDFSVVIENIQFHRATIMPKEGEHVIEYINIMALHSWLFSVKGLWYPHVCVSIPPLPLQFLNQFTDFH